jgi:hypothetical protein
LLVYVVNPVKFFKDRQRDLENGFLLKIFGSYMIYSGSYYDCCKKIAISTVAANTVIGLARETTPAL